MLFLFDALLPDWWLPAALGSLLVLPLLILGAFAARLRPWHLPQHTPVDPATLPGDVRRQTQPWLGRLGFLGFVAQGCSRSQDENQEPCYLWRFANIKDRSVAVMKAHFAAGPKARPTLSLTLFSFLPDGSVIVTADRAPAPCIPGHWQASHKRYSTLEAQILDHLARLDGLPVMVLPVQQIDARLAVEERAVPEAMLASGHYSPLADGSAGAKPALAGRPALAWKGLLAFINGTDHPSGRRTDVAAAAKKGDVDFEDKAPAKERSATESADDTLTQFRELTATKGGAKYYASRIGRTVLTVVLCLAAFEWKSLLQMLQIVLGLIAFHEFGHWLMMRIFGFKGMGGMFVPFLNPLDRARKLHAPAWQQLIVILAGPLPGLLAGTAIMVAGVFMPLPDWLLDVGGVAVLLNAFHLLPFLPLDGGRVVDLLIFRDLPFLRPFFTGLSGILVLTAWFFTRSREFFYIGLGMLGGLAWDIRMVRVVRGGRRLGWKDASDEDETLRRIFQGIREEGNDGFFADQKWHRQIEVLLEEVMRKRPGFLLRIFGGGAYLASWLLALLIFFAVFWISEAGGKAHVRRMAEHTEEFRQDFPVSPTPATDELAAPFRALEAKSHEGMDTSALDHFDWPSASRVVNAGMVREDTFAIWMNALCSRMEKSLQEGRSAEAARRAEIVLHARTTMEPAATLRIRRTLWDSELRSYDALEQLAAAGQLDEASITRLDSRINALNKAPVPAVENRLLVDGGIWSDSTGTAFDAPKLLEGDAEPEIEEPRFWRRARTGLSAFMNHVCPFREGKMASAALAHHWKETRKVGELPPTLAGADEPYAGEASFILDFCESHQRVAWRRLAALSALRLEGYRLKKGELPHMWSHEVAGGAVITLDRNDKPKLVLEDRRDMAKLVPSWLKQLNAPPTPIHHECPLNPGTPLSKK